MKKGKLFIGTSGYSYSHWDKGVFYPKNLPQSKMLEYYSRQFNTVEMNYPFYKLPSSKSFKHWREVVPRSFVFSVKVSRYISHIKHFHRCKSAWKIFLGRALHLQEKLGPFLFQCPPNWKKDLDSLKEFMKMIEKSNKYTHRDLLTLRFALEFRHPSWFSEDVYRILNRQKNISLCFADSPQWPCQEIIIGNLIYIRMHGGKTLYGSNYTEEKLITWVKKIKKWLRQNRDVYVYFNNDARGYAPKNAQKLKKMIAE